jgi:hypothetical protein
MLIPELEKRFKLGTAFLVGLCSRNIEFLSVFDLSPELLSLATFGNSLTLVALVAHLLERGNNKIV